MSRVTARNPDANLAPLALHYKHLTKAYVLPTIDYAKEMARRRNLSPEHQAQVRAMIRIAEQTARLFERPITHQMLPELEQADQRFTGVLITLSAYDGDDTALKIWAQKILGSGRDWQYLAEVATLPLLERHENWTTKERPIPYLGKAARHKMIDAYQHALPHEEEVPLDEAPELRAPDPAPADDPLDELIAAVLTGADSEVKAYGELVLDGATHEEAGRKLGWYKKRAHRVSVRYRRHLKKAAATRDLRALRQALENWRSSASVTVSKVIFRDDRAGQRRSYFEHKERSEI